MSEISVIVPVYKVEKDLRRCMDSILSQTFSDFDIILIDDGSPDRCPAICDEYVRKDTRVHVIHQKNQGPSAARNAGIDWAFKNSSSNYLAFIDSDDCIHPQYLERLYYAITQNNADVSVCKHQYISLQESLEDKPLLETLHAYIISAEDLMVMQASNFNYAWAKLFSKNCFKELRYPENISFGEDNLIIFKALFECNEIVYIEEKLYYYFYNENGITKSPWSPRSLECFEGIRTQLDYYKSKGYTKAYNKEIELYIQQCAYQIHRIREDKRNLKKNKKYLILLLRQMQSLFLQYANFHPQDDFYWYEALYPKKAYILGLYIRIKRNHRELGFKGMMHKILEKLFHS